MHRPTRLLRLGIFVDVGFSRNVAFLDFSPSFSYFSLFLLISLPKKKEEPTKVHLFKETEGLSW